MPDTINCPTCKGTGVIVAPTPPPPPPPPPAPPAPDPAELWPILVPLGIFFLFFAFLFI